MEEVISPPPKGKEGEPPSREVPLFPPSSSSTFSQQQHAIPSAGSFRQPSSVPMYPVVNETIVQPGRERPSGSVKAKEDEEQKTRNDIMEYERIMKLQASQIRSDLSYACIIPAILLISIAGKPGLISLSFGGVATYLLDLLESVEVNFVAVSRSFMVLPQLNLGYLFVSCVGKFDRPFFDIFGVHCLRNLGHERVFDELLVEHFGVPGDGRIDFVHFPHVHLSIQRHFV